MGLESVEGVDGTAASVTAATTVGVSEPPLANQASSAILKISLYVVALNLRLTRAVFMAGVNFSSHIPASCNFMVV